MSFARCRRAPALLAPEPSGTIRALGLRGLHALSPIREQRRRASVTTTHLHTTSRPVGSPAQAAKVRDTEQPSRPIVGVIGLGTMGGAIARHLLSAGYAVVGHDVAAAARRAFEDAGGAPLGAPSDVAAHSDVIVLSLPSQAAFEEVVTGPGGLTSATPCRATIAL